MTNFTFHGDELDVIPADWPKKMPPGAKALADADWAFSPASSRIDEYKGWVSRRDGRVFVWWRSPGLELAPVRFRPYVSGPFNGDEKDSFAQCLRFGWETERDGYELTEPDRLGPAFLDEATLARVVASVWAEAEEASPDIVLLHYDPTIHALAALWVGQGSWPRTKESGAGGMVYAVGNARLRNAVRQYVSRFILQKGAVPLGDHDIDEEVAPVPPGTAESDGIARAVHRPGRVTLKAVFPARPRLKLSELAGYDLEWVDAPANADARCRALAWDGDGEAADDDVYVVRDGGRLYFARLHGDDVTCALAAESRRAGERALFLDNYESGHTQTWNWKDLDTDESSQEFDSEEEALQAMRDDKLEWSRFEDLG